MFLQLLQRFFSSEENNVKTKANTVKLHFLGKFLAQDFIFF